MHTPKRTAIIYSTQDIAGVNIAKYLQPLAEQLAQEGAYLHEITTEHIMTEGLCEHIPADQYIFASRHRSASQQPCLSAHPIGNWNDNVLGGKPRALSMSSSHLLKTALQAIAAEFNHNRIDALLDLKKDMMTSQRKDIMTKTVTDSAMHAQAPAPMEVTMEATHHGPYMTKPALFMEVGSSEKDWANEEYAAHMAQAILQTLQYLNDPSRNEERKTWKTAIAVGGTHYCAQFNKRVINGNLALSHICPKHNLPHLDEAMIRQAIECTQEKTDFFIIDWKGMGTEKERITTLLDEMSIPWIRSDKE